jgi:hypothetical protein
MQEGNIPSSLCLLAPPVQPDSTQVHKIPCIKVLQPLCRPVHLRITPSPGTCRY